MSFALPSFESGEFSSIGVKIPLWQSGEFSISTGIKIPRFETGQFAPLVVGLQFPLWETGDLALPNVLRVPSFLSGEFFPLIDGLQVPSFAVGEFGMIVTGSVSACASTADATINWKTTGATTCNTATAALSRTAWGAFAGSVVVFSGDAFGSVVTTADAESSFDVATLATAPRLFIETVDSGLMASSSAGAYILFVVEGESAIEVESSAPVSVVYLVSAESVAALLTGTQFVRDFTDGWAYNLNTGAASFYENFAFNSFARIGGKYFGCNSAGIFLLDGDRDGSAEIDATITLGTSRLDSDSEKTAPVAYVGAKSAEPMRLTCRVEGVEFSYEFSRETAAMAPARVKPGKGLKGTYWQFEIENQNGADIDLDMLEIITAPGSRKA